MNYTYNVDYCYNNCKKLNILIVDDDMVSADLFKDILESYGHTVKTLDEGVKCLSNCMKNKYDIIFLDYHIGDLNGADLADCLKDVLNTKSYIYAYTGDSNPIIMKKCKDIGMNGAIIKPLNIINIDKILSNITDDRQKQDKFNIWY